MQIIQDVLENMILWLGLGWYGVFVQTHTPMSFLINTVPIDLTVL